MDRLRVAFLGSPDLGVPCLEALAAAGDFDLSLVVTAPDRRRARGGAAVPTPVGRAALELGLPLLRWDDGMAVFVRERIESLRLDALVVIAFSRLLRPRLLRAPRLGCMNLHASILPWGRGASPIQQAILDGLPETGWSAMRMAAGLDEGPVFAKSAPIRIESDWSAGDLYTALKLAAPQFLLDSLRGWAAGELEPVEQVEADASYCGKIEAADGAIDWSEDASTLSRKVRAYRQWPTAFCRRGGSRVAVLAARWTERPERAEPGERLAAITERSPLRIACGTGALELLDLQPEGKRAMSAQEYLNGQPLAIGEKLERG